MSATTRKILISGAAGFIGSSLTRRLLENGDSVGIIEHTACGLHRLEDVFDRLTIFRLDLRDQTGVLSAIAAFEPQALIHLATRYAVSHTTEDFEDLVQTNVTGSLNLLEGAIKTGVSLFINTSSCFVYAPSSNPLPETAPLQPMNLYALTKLQTELACSFYADNRGLKVRTLRLFPPYGPADHIRRLIPHVIRCFQTGSPLKLTSGQQRWDFIDVGDVVQAYIQALDQPVFGAAHQIINIGSGRAERLRDVVNLIARLMETDQKPEWGALPHRENERMVLMADIHRAGVLLDWEPIVSLEDGLSAAIAWFRDHNPER